MKTEIIKSESRLKRYKSLSFTLSFFFTGLGQVYNGNLSRAFIFTALRFLLLVVIPLFTVTQDKDFSVLFVILPAAFSVLIWLISLFEAMYSSSGKLAYNLKKYNSVLFYMFYSLVSSALIIASVIFVLSFFTVDRMTSDNMKPGLMKNEYILINKYAIEDINAGDVVVFSSNNNMLLGRVIAKEGNLVSNKNNIFYINETPLTYSIIPKDDLEKMMIENSEDLFYEINWERKYPVRLEQKKDKISSELLLLGPGKYYMAFDNRSSNNTYHIIGSDDVAGRVDGIIFSRQIMRIFNKMYSKAE